MGFRRRTRRRALLVGAVAGGAVAHNRGEQAAEEEQAYDQAPAEEQAPAQEQAPAYAPPPADPADEIEHLAQLHDLGRADRRRVRVGEGENPWDLNAPSDCQKTFSKSTTARTRSCYE